MNIEDVEKARKGDLRAFERIIEENKLYLYNIAKSILRNEEDIEDAFSIAIYNAYKCIKKLKKDEFFKTWITRILINECKKIIRKRKDNVSIDECEGILYDELQNEGKEEIDVLYAIKCLNKELQDVIILFYYNEFKISEIAKIMNIPEGTVKSRMNTAKKQLYEILKERSA